MNEQMLNKLEYIIFEDEDFKKATRDLLENKEEIIPHLLQERGVELTYPQFQVGIIKIFKRFKSNENNVLSDELSDDELDKVVGGVSSDPCVQACMTYIEFPKDFEYGLGVGGQEGFCQNEMCSG